MGLFCKNGYDIEVPNINKAYAMGAQQVIKIAYYEKLTLEFQNMFVPK